MITKTDWSGTISPSNGSILLGRPSLTRNSCGADPVAHAEHLPVARARNVELARDEPRPRQRVEQFDPEACRLQQRLEEARRRAGEHVERAAVLAGQSDARGCCPLRGRHSPSQSWPCNAVKARHLA
jgi:hypothetical protein